MAASKNVFNMAFSCASSALSDKSVYQTFARTVSPSTKSVGPIVALFVIYQWKQAGIFFTSDSNYETSAHALRSRFQELQAQKMHVRVGLELWTPGHEEAELSRLIFSGAKILILYGQNSQLGQLMIVINKLGINRAGYAFIMSEVIEPTFFQLPNGQLDKRIDPAAIKLLNVGEFYPKSQSYNLWIQKFKARTKAEFNFTISQVDPYVIPLYESIYYYAHAVGLAVRTGVDVHDGREMMKLIPQISIDVFENRVYLDGKGDRNADWALYNWVNGSNIEIAIYYSQTTNYSSFSEEIVWPGDTTEVPLGSGLECFAAFEVLATSSGDICQKCLKHSVNLVDGGTCQTCPKGMDCPGGSELGGTHIHIHISHSMLAAFSCPVLMLVVVGAVVPVLGFGVVAVVEVCLLVTRLLLLIHIHCKNTMHSVQKLLVRRNSG